MATTVMASSMSSLAFAAGSVRARRLNPVVHVLAPRRRALVVRAQTEPDVDPTKETTTSSSSSSPSPIPTPNIPTPPKPTTKASPPPSLFDAMAFDGPAPERINGRLAMLGFVSALAVEASTHGGAGLLAQAGSGPGFAKFAVAALVFSVASLVPLLRGVSPEASGAGRVMNADAEIWNGRFAMLGLVALAFTEYLTGSPFINA